MAGIPAIAISLHLGKSALTRWDLATEWATQVLQTVVSHGVPPTSVLNINLPITDLGHDHLGIKVVRASVSPMVDRYEPVHEPHEEHARYHAKDHLSFRDREPGTDVVALFERYITVTPLHFDPTIHEQLESWRERLA